MENRKNHLRNIFSVLLVSFSVGLFAQNKFSFKEDILAKTAIGLDYNYIGRNSLAVAIRTIREALGIAATPLLVIISVRHISSCCPKVNSIPAA